MKLWRERNTWHAKGAEQKLARIDRAAVRSIAIIKHAAFGDLLLTRPFLLTLREHFPDASLTFSAVSHYLRGLPEDLVDRVHVTPGKKERPGLRARIASFRALGYHDLLFDLTASTRSFQITRANPAGFKIGYQHRGVHRWVYDAAIPRADFRFEAETFLEQLNVVGVQFDWPPRFGMEIEPLHRERPYIVYFPTASEPRKAWPVENFARLIGECSAALPDHEHVVLSGLADWEQDVARRLGHEHEGRGNVSVATAGKQDPNLIRGAATLVSNDTGIRHLGIAAGTATVCVFTRTSPYGYWPRFGRHEVVFEPDGGDPPVDKVAAAVLRTVGAQTSGAAADARVAPEATPKDTPGARPAARE